MLSIPYINFWLDLKDLFLLLDRKEITDMTLLVGKIEISILGSDRISLIDSCEFTPIYFIDYVDNSIIIEDRIASETYTIHTIDSFTKDIIKALSESNTEKDAIAF